MGLLPGLVTRKLACKFLAPCKKFAGCKKKTSYTSFSYIRQKTYTLPGTYRFCDASSDANEASGTCVITPSPGPAARTATKAGQPAETGTEPPTNATHLHQTPTSATFPGFSRQRPPPNGARPLT